MRGDAVLGDLVHLAGADLHLDALLLGADQAGVQRAVAVRLGRRDVVLEAAGNGRVAAVQDAQCMVAVADVLDHHAEGHGVGELLEAEVALLHLAPDRVGRLHAAGDLGIDAAFLEVAGELLADPFQQVAALFAQELEARRGSIPGRRD